MAADVLGSILDRKRIEVGRRSRPSRASAPAHDDSGDDRSVASYAALARADAPVPRVIAEIKHRSPSAGVIRVRKAGAVAQLAREYEQAGAAAVSVLCDGPGFGGTPLDVRRVARSVDVPVLFKEFVLAESQIALARACGASMVLLLVRALSPERLNELVGAVHVAGMAPVVEAADAAELSIALATSARVVGINSRDLRTFEMDGVGARDLVNRIPADRIAVYMSGVRSRDDLVALSQSRADAVLVGEGLMRTENPGAELARWLSRPAR